MFRRIRIRWQVWRGKAIDIWSKSPYPANVLSNLYGNSFFMTVWSVAVWKAFCKSLSIKT